MSASVLTGKASGRWEGKGGSIAEKGMGFPRLPESGETRDFSGAKMIEDQERCLKCGRQEGLQGVAVTIGRKTFHLFYLCVQCGNVGIEQLLRIIGSYKEKNPDSDGGP